MKLAGDGLPPLREIVAAYDLKARKTLSQNFLFDLNLTDRIARAAGPLEGATIVEIGAGPGGLTRALLSAGAQKVIALEQDERFLPALEAIAAHWPNRLEIIVADALTFPYGEWAPPCRICANLPYHIATPLLTGWLETDPWPPWFDRLILMFQREVAERIVATPENREDYGRLSVLANWRCKTRILFDIPPDAFTPPPKVTSSVVELIPHPNPLPCRASTLTALTLAAFGQRRKMLRQSLKTFAAVRGLDLAEWLKEAGLDPTSRAEIADVATFAKLACAAETCQTRA